MTDFHLVDMLCNLPSPHDIDAVKFGIENWQIAINELAVQNPSLSNITDIADAVLKDSGTRALLETIFGNSFISLNVYSRTLNSSATLSLGNLKIQPNF